MANVWLWLSYVLPLVSSESDKFQIFVGLEFCKYCSTSGSRWQPPGEGLTGNVKLLGI